MKILRGICLSYVVAASRTDTIFNDDTCHGPGRGLMLVW